MGRITEFIEYLHSHIGDAYVWGAQGQILSDMTQAEIEAFVSRRETSDKNEKRALAFIAEAKKNPLYAFDCSGLIMNWFQNIKGWSKDKSAATLYGECTDRGELKATTKLDVGDLLFRRTQNDDGTMSTYHVGVYVGDDWEIEAKGRDDGVVLNKVNRNYWTHHGKHPFLYKEDEPDPKPATAKVITLTTPYMRGNDIKALQTALNGLGYDCGEADGIAGARTIKGIQDFVAAHGKAAELPKTAECTVVIGGRKYTGEIKW